MGASLRKEASAYFTATLTAAPASGPTDAEFIAKVKQYERSLCGGSELSSVAAPVAAAVLTSVAHSGRVRWLLRLCSEVMRRCVENPHDLDAGTPAVVHVTELLLRHLLRLVHGHSATLVAVLEATGDGGVATVAGAEAQGRTAAAAAPAAAAAADAACEDTAAVLCRMALTFLASVPIDSNTVATHLEVLRLLLTMTSSALHHGTDFHEQTMDLFTELMMSSPLLGECLETLLGIFVTWGTAGYTSSAPTLYQEGHQPSLLNLFQVFGGGGGAGAGGAGGGAGGSGVGGPGAPLERAAYVLDVPTVIAASPSSGGAGGGAVPKDPAAVLVKACSCWELLGRHAAALLCVLVVHQKGSGRNPALEYVVAMRDGSPTPFVGILSAIRWRLASFPEVSILLYVLLHDHHDFLHAILTDDPELLVSTLQQLLELAYKTCKDTTRVVMAPSPTTTTAATATSSANSKAPAASATANGGNGTAHNTSSPGDAGALPPMGDVLNNAVLGRIVLQLRVFSYPFINFMASTLLLLVSQDRVVNRLMCSTPCLPGHPLQRFDDAAPVGALATVVLALGISKGLNERNEALIAVFAPCLVNLAPFVHHMDPFTSQRVSALLSLALKKIQRAGVLLMTATAEHPGSEKNPADGSVAGLSAVMSNTSSAGSSTTALPAALASAEDARALEEILAMYVRQLRTIVEAVEALLRGADRCNEHLIYELLYSRSRLIDDVDAAVAAQCPHAATTKQLLANIAEMIKSCEADIASSNQAQTPQEILAILRRGQQQQRGAGGSGGDGTSAAAAAHDGAGGGGGSGSVGGHAHEDSSHAFTSSASAALSPAAAASGDGGSLTSVTSGPEGRLGEGASTDLVYSYEESPHSYDFFGPFVWATLLSAARLPGAALWCQQSSELPLFPH